MRKFAAILAVASVAAVMLVAIAEVDSADAATPPIAINGKNVSFKLRAAMRKLEFRVEHRRGFAKSKFKHWNDADGDCRDTRAEVLQRESRGAVTGGCTIRRGNWYSYYDGKRFYRAANLDIDQLVPLAEAWDSGARNWSAARRQAYANDLYAGRSLVAVSASSNRSKGDRDPAGWLPRYGKCRYVLEWASVKLRWDLKVDARERKALQAVAAKCRDKRVTVYKAVVKPAGGSVGGGAGAGNGGGSGGAGGGNCTPGYSPCLPPKSDYDCAGGSGNGPGYAHGPIYVTGSDPYDLDSDGDGVGCET